jgi:hypothetical protein
MRKSAKQHWPKWALCALVLTLSGCAGSLMDRWTSIVTPATPVAGASVPMVRNCIRINDTDAPAKFVCNGKTYTSRELHAIRVEAANKGVAVN